MVNSKGFAKGCSSSSSSKKRSKRTKKGYDPQLSFKFERYVAKHLGKSWNKGCVLMNFDDGVHKRLGMKIPIEKHQEFSEERQQQIKKLGKRFGLDELEIALVNVRETGLVNSWLKN